METALKFAKGQVNEATFDFYSCYKCGRLITRLEEADAFNPKSPRLGKICPCGSLKYRPCNLPWWGWLLPRVWKFALQRIRRLA